ncbi:hypothetical protein, conserved, partial [Babesia bigemina]
MGFLYQVLKDVSEKQPYSVGKEELKKLVTDLKTKLSTGREGFKVIAQVARKVREYNESVERSNNAVKKPIDTLLGQVDDKFKTKVSNILKDNAASGKETFTEEQIKQADDAIKEVLEQCLKHASIFNIAFNTVETKINDMNSILRDKVKNAGRNVLHETVRLTEVSDKAKKDFKEMTAKIRSVLEWLGKDVNEQIDAKVNELVDSLRSLVAEILHQLNGVYDKLGSYVNELGMWINNTESFIEGVTKKYVEPIVKRGVGYVNQDAIKHKVEELAKKGEQLYWIFESTKDNVTKLVEEVKQKVTELETAVQVDC